VFNLNHSERLVWRMQVRKFRAGTIQEATNMVKRELGSEALILSTQRLGKEKGRSKHGRRDTFEIYAIPGDAHRETEKHSTCSSDCLSDVKSDLMNIKETLFLLSRSRHLMEDLAENPEVIGLYAKMIRSGIAETNAHSFLNSGGALEENAHSEFEDLHERVLQEILKVIDVTDPFGRSKDQTIAAFVGPTGVGKTTTVAKLMANFSLKQKRSIGLISIDNYRIGAMEQLKTYASILGVPCFPAFTRSDLQFALKRLKDKDVILIDTAGQSHYDMQRMEELARLVTSNSCINCHLLLSAATNESEMDSAAKNFGMLNFNSYIFTKTDETKARGVIINQLLKLKKPVSFITTGQRVPEDIFKATRTKILNLMFQ